MSGNHNVKKDFSKSSKFTEHLSFHFTDISKTFTKTVKVIYLEINNENAIIYFKLTFKVP